MKITVTRKKSNKYETLSDVLIDDIFFCNGLEDEFRTVKVMHETRIPSGTYSVIVRNFGGFNDKYMARFPVSHKGMLEVVNVPNFSGILIHCGNTEKDTSGCLLLGKEVESVGRYTLISSGITYEAFYKRVIDAAIKKQLTIEYIDSDKK